MKRSLNNKMTLIGSTLFLLIGTLGTLFFRRIYCGKGKYCYGEVSLNE